MLVVELIPSGDASAVVSVQNIDQMVASFCQDCPSAYRISKSGQSRAGVHNVTFSLSINNALKHPAVYGSASG